MRNFIFGTDWHEDCDDVVAMRLLARAHKENKLNLLGVVINSCTDYSVSSLVGFLQSENVSVPIGIDLNARDYGKVARYHQRLALPSITNSDADDGVKLYRKLLASSPFPVEIIEVGFLQVIANVLRSGPDEISPLDGVTLFKEKVAKVWCMGGKWDVDKGKEYNFSHTLKACDSASALCLLCPSPITFLGYEVGVDVITPLPKNNDDALRLAMIDHGAINGRPSWDPLTVLLAIAGDEEKAGYDFVEGIATVDALTGENTFTTKENGPHKYVIKKFNNEHYANIICSLIE